MSEEEASGPGGPGAVPELATVLDLAPAQADRFVAAASGTRAGLYGGQLLAQALLAAAATVPADRSPHSLHAYFLRRGDSRREVGYAVDRERDGRAYTARRVTARQGDQVLFGMATSFARSEEGADLQAVEMPVTRPPEASVPLAVHLPGVEVRDPDPHVERQHPARIWMRATGEVGADPRRHAAVLAYVSDLYSGMTSFVDLRPDDAMATLDHALWFHRPVRADRWMLFDHQGVSLAAGRGWYRGTVFDEAGVVVASLTQEMVLRQGRRG